MALSIVAFGAAANAGSLSNALNKAADSVSKKEQQLENAQKEHAKKQEAQRKELQQKKEAQQKAWEQKKQDL